MWDFETDPEYQRKLDWVEEFMRTELEPLDLAPLNPYDKRNPQGGGPGPAGGATRTRGRRALTRPGDGLPLVNAGGHPLPAGAEQPGGHQPAAASRRGRA